jgi:hypothetical protein
MASTDNDMTFFVPTGSPKGTLRQYAISKLIGNLNLLFIMLGFNSFIVFLPIKSNKNEDYYIRGDHITYNKQIESDRNFH